MQSRRQSKAYKLVALILGFVIPLGLFACGLNPNPTNFEGRKISSVSIQFKGEHGFVDESRIQRFISSKVGTPYSSARLDTDIKAVYSSGYVEDVRFLASLDGAAVRLIVEITTRPPFGPPLVSGNTVFSDLKLAKISGLKFGKAPTNTQIENARRNIEKFYQSNGYQDAKVTLTHPWKDKGEDDNFVFLIEEGTTKQP
jgi:outer membrane protein insertion porin family